MRWKALEFLGNLHPSDKITFDFKSINCQPIVQVLENFENELMFMIKNIQFRKVSNSFQSQVNEDIKLIRSLFPETNLATFMKRTGKLMKSYCMKTSQRLKRKWIRRK